MIPGLYKDGLEVGAQAIMGSVVQRQLQTRPGPPAPPAPPAGFGGDIGTCQQLLNDAGSVATGGTAVGKRM